MFQPDVREIQPIVSVRQGVQDNSLSTALQAGADMYQGFRSSQVRADLRGEEGHVQDVSTDTDYGAIVTKRQERDYTFTTPEGEEAEQTYSVPRDTLNKELNLTRIASARKQGRISGSHALALANANLRQAINKNPMYADELRKEAETFFAEMGLGGSRGGTGGGFFGPSEQEAAEARAQQQRRDALVALEMKAYEEGTTVEGLREANRRITQGKLAKARMEELSMQESLNAREFGSLLGEAKNGHTIELEAILTRPDMVGRIGPEQMPMIRNEIARRANDMRAGINAARGKIPRTEVDAYLSSVASWETSMRQMAEDNDFQTLMANKKTTLNDSIAFNFMTHVPFLHGMHQIGGQAGFEFAIEALQNKEMMGLLKDLNPAQAKLFDIMDDESMTTYFGSIINSINRRDFSPIQTEPSVMTPTPETVDATALNLLNGRINVGSDESAAELRKNSATHVLNLGKEDGRAFRPFLENYKLYTEVRDNPETQKQFLQAFQYRVNSLGAMVQNGDLDPTAFVVEGPGGIDVEASPRARGRTDVSGITPRITVTRDPNRRVLFEGRLSRNMLKELSDLYSAAAAFPGLQVNGKSLTEVLNQKLGRSDTLTPQVGRELSTTTVPPRREGSFSASTDVAADLQSVGINLGTPAPAPTGSNDLSEEEMAVEAPNSEEIKARYDAAKEAGATTTQLRDLLIQLGIPTEEAMALSRQWD